MQEFKKDKKYKENVFFQAEYEMKQQVYFYEITNQDILDFLLRLVGGWDFFIIFFAFIVKPYNDQKLQA